MQLALGIKVFDISERRASVIKALFERSWFKATSRELQHQLVELPEDAENKDDWTPFLEDLAARPDEIGGWRVLRLVKLLVANYAVIAVFKVANAAGRENEYEYVSWKHGNMSGAKGVVFVRTDGKITHFAALRGEKFGPAKNVWDSVGGFADIGADGVYTVNERFLVEFQEELGLAEMPELEVIDLGRIMTDAGMTNNNPGVFAAIMDADDAKNLSPEPVNPDDLELKTSTVIFPMSQLPQQALESGDTFFLTAVARSVAKGIIPANSLAPQA
jgi:hypothetical protein